MRSCGDGQQVLLSRAVALLKTGETPLAGSPAREFLQPPSLVPLRERVLLRCGPRISGAAGAALADAEHVVELRPDWCAM